LWQVLGSHSDVWSGHCFPSSIENGVLMVTVHNMSLRFHTVRQIALPFITLLEAGLCVVAEGMIALEVIESNCP
jgi:hypothetical protein